MLRNIRIRNLRSVRRQKVDIAPITVLYGPNGSGKSTLLHSLAIFKNVVLNPNQPIDSFFNLGFANFGGFEQVVFDHNPDEKIELEICHEHNSVQVTYGVTLAKKSGHFKLNVKEPYNVALELETAFPYPGNKQTTTTVEYEGNIVTINWNGILAQTTSAKGTPEAGKLAQKLATVLNSSIEVLRRSDFVHLKRGFTKPHYGTTPLTPTIFTEDEVATLLANDPYLEGEVSYHLEQIVQKDLRVRLALGTNVFRLNTVDKKTGLSTELVNDGFGINQLAYLLAKSLRRDISCICVEEPEIHLHPKALRNLAYVLIRLAKEKEKTLIISTHSEHFVLALLGAVSKEKLSSGEISCYLCTKERKESKFQRQQVDADGRIEGGLMSFMEGELKDLKEILGVSKKGGQGGNRPR